MRIFISYKYTHNKDKENLKKELEELSDLINSWGDETFILGRDVKKWKHIHLGSFRLIPLIYKNMKKCDIVYLYLDSNVFSKGVFFEMVIAKILNKKVVAFVKPCIQTKMTTGFYDKVVPISSLTQISKILV